jgi:hypothetical protein
MTVRIDQFGNMRRPDPSGHRGVKRVESHLSRIRRAEDVRRDRRARVLLTRTRTEL